MSDTVVHWFEIPTLDLDRAAKFYSAVLNTELGDMDGPAGPMKSFQNGDMPVGAPVKGPQSTPTQEGSVVYFGSDDIEAALQRVEACGGEVLLPKTSIGPFGHTGQFTDSEGNRVALHSS